MKARGTSEEEEAIRDGAAPTPRRLVAPDYGQQRNNEGS